MRAPEKQRTQQHGRSTKAGNARRHVGVFVEGKSKLYEVEHTVSVERDFNESKKSSLEPSHGLRERHTELRARIMGGKSEHGPPTAGQAAE